MSIFAKFFKATEAQANKAANAALDADPIAVMNLENEKDAEKIHSTQPKMEKFKGQLRGLERQVHDEETDLATLDAQINACLADQQRLLAAGDTTGAAQAEADANAVQNTYNEKDATHKQTVMAYGQLKAQFDSAKADIENANAAIAQRQKQATNLGHQLELSETVKTAKTMANDVASSISVSGVGSNSSRAAQKAQELIDQNFGAAEVADIYNGKSTVDPAKELAARVAARTAATTNVSQLAARRAKLGIGKVEAVPQPTPITQPVTVTTTTTVTPQPATAGV